MEYIAVPADLPTLSEIFDEISAELDSMTLAEICALSYSEDNSGVEVDSEEDEDEE